VPPPAPVPTPPPAPGAELANRLPGVPAADGPLLLNVIYPPMGAPITARDSNFIFGSTGSGIASLRINNIAVPVAPNGAFLAFLPVPANGIYNVEAAKGRETARLEHRVRLPAEPPVLTGAAIITSSAYPAGAVSVLRGETIEIGFQGTPGGRALLFLPDGTRIPLLESGITPEGPGDAANFRVDANGRRTQRSAWYRGVMPAVMLVSRDTAVNKPMLLMPGCCGTGVKIDDGGGRGAFFELIVGRDTARVPVRLNLAVLDPAVPRVGIATPPANAPHDWTIRGRPGLSGPFHWFWPPGTQLHLTGERSGYYRVRLAETQHAWVPTTDVQLLPPGAPPPAVRVGGVRFVAGNDYVDLRIPLGTRLPFFVDSDGRTLEVDLYGGTSETNYFQYGSLDPLISQAMWSQPANGVYRVRIELAQPVWGYQASYDASDVFVLRIRRPPRIAVNRPLAGLLVAVDPGHPPAGANGPTGLTEAQANLAIALRLRTMLEAAGARVLMTRSDDRPVDLALRPRMAADSNAHVLVSIHNNAFPDGVNPWTNNGTSVYYFQPHSLDLARHMLRELLAELGTRDIGVGRADLALVRPTWLPSILSETLFLMIPQQEAALRDPTVQERIARAHLRALEAFLRSRASS
jgi:N-acetylmuramoyl-L-alanine amidase